MQWRRGKSRVGEEVKYLTFTCRPRGVSCQRKIAPWHLSTDGGRGDQSACTTRTSPLIDWPPSTKLVVSGGVWSLDCWKARLLEVGASGWCSRQPMQGQG